VNSSGTTLRLAETVSDFGVAAKATLDNAAFARL
jgi:hypothetical protein